MSGFEAGWSVPGKVSRRSMVGADEPPARKSALSTITARTDSEAGVCIGSELETSCDHPVVPTTLAIKCLSDRPQRPAWSRRMTKLWALVGASRYSAMPGRKTKDEHVHDLSRLSNSTVTLETSLGLPMR